MESTIILWAEDDINQVELFKECFENIGIKKIEHFTNGKDLVDYLRKENRKKYQHLIILDLSMPIMDGFEVLEDLKKDNELKVIPIIVLTSAGDKETIDKCYALGCSSYIVKPIKFDQFKIKQKILGDFIGIISVPIK